MKWKWCLQGPLHLLVSQRSDTQRIKQWWPILSQHCDYARQFCVPLIAFANICLLQPWYSPGDCVTCILYNIALPEAITCSGVWTFPLGRSLKIPTSYKSPGASRVLVAIIDVSEKRGLHGWCFLSMCPFAHLVTNLQIYFPLCSTLIIFAEN